MSKKKTTPTWHEKGAALLEQYLKKAKSPKGRIMVFSYLGDLLLAAGKGAAVDTTSAGSIFAAMNTATGGLNSLFKTKSSTIRFGDTDKELWMVPQQNQWIIVGAHVALKTALLKPIAQHLKAASKSSKAVRAPEALEGMSETSIDVAFAQVVDRG